MPDGNSGNYSDFNDYEDCFVQLVEMIYGKGFLSQGGELTVDKMFINMDLNDLKILDIGSGLGAPDFHIARKFNVEIIGVDPQKHLIDDATKQLEAVKPPLN